DDEYRHLVISGSDSAKGWRSTLELAPNPGSRLDRSRPGRAILHPKSVAAAPGELMRYPSTVNPIRRPFEWIVSNSREWAGFWRYVDLRILRNTCRITYLQSVF